MGAVWPGSPPGVCGCSRVWAVRWTERLQTEVEAARGNCAPLAAAPDRSPALAADGPSPASSSSRELDSQTSAAGSPWCSRTAGSACAAVWTRDRVSLKPGARGLLNQEEEWTYLSVRAVILSWSRWCCTCLSSWWMRLSSSSASTWSLASRVCSSSWACSASTWTRVTTAAIQHIASY